MTVTALLVSHDGARWLPAVLDGLAEQTRPPDRLVVVDTGSTDAGPDLVLGRYGEGVLVRMPPGTSYPDAVARGLAEAASGNGDEDAWVWLLHDDSRPAADCLERLLDVAGANPSVSTFGPKIREWPSLRRLLEVGVTISGTGRRETGLERGEYDQGQHDRTREVLAVSSAGMLVRRDVLDALGGFDRRLPLFGNDLDLGWRAARAGHRTMVVPDAVVFHAEAAHRGVRTGDLASHHRRKERAGALYTLLTGCAPAAVPLVALRLALGSLLRALALLLVRAPREAFDEMAALVGTLLRPDRVLRGRRDRRRTATVPAGDVRPLLAPVWLPYRHGLDLVSELAAAVAHQAAATSAARRAGRSGATDAGPVPSEAQNLPEDTGLLARLLTSRKAAATALLVVVSLVALRDLVGTGALAGGALLPAPDSAADWWHLHVEGRHLTGVGSSSAAAPSVLPLALAGSLLLGNAGLVVDLLFLLSVPLSAWGAWGLLAELVRRWGPGMRRPGPANRAASWSVAWGALTYALLPVLSGAVHQGRLGTVAVTVLLPWVARAALLLGPDEPRDRRWRAAWRTALGLALLAAFAPVTWLVAAAVAVVLAAAGTPGARSRWRGRWDWGPVAASVLPVWLLLAPWALEEGGLTRAWLLDTGLAAPEMVPDLGAWEVVTGRAAEVGSAPAWISVGLAVAALASLVRRNTRSPVLVCWAVVVAGLAAVAVLDHEGLWAGSALLLVQAAAVAAATLGGAGIGDQLSGRSFGWRQPVGLLLVLGALLVPVAGVLWWVAVGVTGPLDRGPAHRLPAYMVAAAERDPAAGTLVVSGSGDRLGYTLVRGPGVRLGEETVAADQEREDALTSLVADLATAATAEQVAELGALGVEFVYLPPPVDPSLAGNLDSVSGLSTASVLQAGARAWQLDGEPTRDLPESAPVHLPLVLLQGVAVVAAVVLAAPTRRRRR